MDTLYLASEKSVTEMTKDVGIGMKKPHRDLFINAWRDLVREKKLEKGECPMLCPAGGEHKFRNVSAENQKKALSGAVNATFMGTGGGVKAKHSSDEGQRVILYCEKCCKHVQV